MEMRKKLRNLNLGYFNVKKFNGKKEKLKKKLKNSEIRRLGVGSVV